MKDIKKLNIKAILNSVYFIDGEKYIKDRFDKLISSEVKYCGMVPDDPGTRIITWVDRELECIVLYLPLNGRAYMTVI